MSISSSSSSNKDSWDGDDDNCGNNDEKGVDKIDGGWGVENDGWGGGPFTNYLNILRAKRYDCDFHSVLCKPSSSNLISSA